MEITPKKSLGQHFLASKFVLKQIVDAAHVSPKETVLEIGPGTGILTEALLAMGANVIAIEKDSRSCDVLRNKCAPQITDGSLKLVEGDILSKETVSSLQSDPGNIISEGKYALVANIPYYITGAILELFLEHGPRPNRMVLLIQKEVADRIVTRNNKESILSISVKAFGTPRIIAKVPPGAFVPPPTVDSAVLAIEKIHPGPFLGDSDKTRAFFGTIRAGFAHKRKFVIRNLEAVATKAHIEQAWGDLKLAKNLRAEDMTIEQWVEVARSISTIPRIS